LLQTDGCDEAEGILYHLTHGLNNFIPWNNNKIQLGFHKKNSLVQGNQNTIFLPRLLRSSAVVFLSSVKEVKLPDF
jgi:hypothetical protein